VNPLKIFLASFLLVPLFICNSASGDDILKKWPDFRYLEPGQLRELPPVIRADLAKLGCRVPKFTKWDARHNAIQGQFLKPGQQDWAVLCQVGDRTGILLYPGGVVSELPLLRGEPNDPGRTIHSVSAFVLQKRAVRDHPEESPPAFDHDGIEDGKIQEPGRVLYYRDHEWTEF
jgi:hypothetical protein